VLSLPLQLVLHRLARNKIARDKHSSLFCPAVSGEEKTFHIRSTPRPLPAEGPTGPGLSPPQLQSRPGRPARKINNRSTKSGGGEVTNLLTVIHVQTLAYRTKPGLSFQL
jgi:hypothetical protein